MRAVAPNADRRVFFVGDSFVAGVGDPEHRGWVGRLAERAHRAGAPITAYNLGVRRDTSDDICRRWTDEVAVRRGAGAQERLVVSFGVNDTSPCGRGTRVAADHSVANLRTLLAEAAAARLPVLVVGTAAGGRPRAEPADRGARRAVPPHLRRSPACRTWRCSRHCGASPGGWTRWRQATARTPRRRATACSRTWWSRCGGSGCWPTDQARRPPPSRPPRRSPRGPPSTSPSPPCCWPPCRWPPCWPRHPAEDAAEQVAEPTARLPARGRPAAEPLRQVRHDDRREDRQELAHQVRGRRRTAGGAELLDDLPALVAEDVADDPLAVVLVDVVEVHPALDQVVVVLTDGGGEAMPHRRDPRCWPGSPRAGRAAPAGWPPPRCPRPPRDGRRGRPAGCGTGCRRQGLSWGATVVGTQPHDRVT